MKTGLSLLIVSLLTGCGFDAPTRTHVAPEPSAQTPDHEPYHPVEITSCDQASAVFESVESSYHEVIACGRMQTQAAQGLPLHIVLSANNIEPETEELLDIVLGGRMQMAEDGVFGMPLTSGSRFELAVQNPDGEQLVHNAFRFDSYLQNVQIQQRYTAAEMMETPTLVNTWLFHFDGPGPLYHLLMPNGAVAKSPIVLRASLDDLEPFFFGMEQDGVFPDLGVFAPLLDLRFETKLEFVDRRGELEIEYQARMESESVRNIQRGVGSPLRVAGVLLRHPNFDATVETTDLQFAFPSGLAGESSYSIVVGDTTAVAFSSYDGGGYPSDREFHCD